MIIDKSRPTDFPLLSKIFRKKLSLMSVMHEIGPIHSKESSSFVNIFVPEGKVTWRVSDNLSLARV